MKINLKIEGMKCGMCEAKVNKIIRDTIPDAKKVKSNKNKGESSFVIKDDSLVEKVIENINSFGYKVLSFDKD